MAKFDVGNGRNDFGEERLLCRINLDLKFYKEEKESTDEKKGGGQEGHINEQ